MNILVLAGGRSPERAVSLVSASKIAKALIKCGHKVCIVDLFYGVDDVSRLAFSSSESDIQAHSVCENAPVLDTQSSAPDMAPAVVDCCKRADLVYIALHGDIGENGKIQAVLDVNKIKYTGSGYAGCFLSMDKNISKIMMKANGVLTANWCLNRNDGSVRFPCVVKPVSGGSSIGISIVNHEAEMNLALKLAEKYDDNVIIEEKIEGREVSVGILADRPLPVIEICPKSGFYDYKNKYQAGRTVEICPADFPAEITEKLQKAALRVHQILNLSYYSRIDFIVDSKNNIYCLEANALPGMTPTSLLPQEAAAAGISYDELCSRIAMNAFYK